MSNVLQAEFAMHAYALRCRTSLVFSIEIDIMMCIALHRHKNRNLRAKHSSDDPSDSFCNVLTCGAAAQSEHWKETYGDCVGGQNILEEPD